MKLVLMALILAACGSGNSAATSDEIGDPADRWVAPDGGHVANGRVKTDGEYPLVISMQRGAEHCGWQNELFLDIAWPLGTVVTRYTDSVRQYVWDPDQSQRFALRGVASENAQPPSDADDTGYRLTGAELWIAPSDADQYVYIKRDGSVQRWPRAERPIHCA